MAFSDLGNESASGVDSHTLVNWKNWPAAQMGQPFSDINSAAAGKRRGFCRLRRATVYAAQVRQAD
jgi:hypothetical protein